MHRATAPLLALASLALACGDPSAPRAASKTATPDAPAGAAPDAPVDPAPKAPVAGKAGPPDRALLKHLAAGRTLSQKKKYKEAIAELEKALAIHDGDAKVLAELGYAALLDGDLERSRKASEKALKATSEPRTRASILYNLGRVHEDKRDKPAAARAYAESLALRDNAEVRRRLDALGEPGPRVVACSAAFASLDELCGCLKRSDELLMLEGPRTCTPRPLDLKSERLQVLEFGTSEIGTQAVEVLVARDDDGLRRVGTLGETYEPGAFGVHNGSVFEGAELKTVGGRDLAVLKYAQHHDDMNLAGLELCTDSTTNVVFCVLGEPTRCPLEITVDSESSCGPGVEAGPEETDPDVLDMAKKVKDNAYNRGAKASYTISDAGVVTVTREGGDPEVLAIRPGTYPLW